MGTMLTELESAMNSLIDVYHKYSLEKGNYHALYRDDLKKLLETECPRYMKVRRGLGAVGVFCLADEALGPWSPTPPYVDSHGSAFAKVFTLRLLSPSS